MALLDEHGAAGVTMDRVAAAAGVGKGTIFHRFGSRSGLLYELVAEGATELMERVSSGPPPLGPGAPAAERLLAFFDAMTCLVTDHVELIAAYRAMPPHPRTEEFHAFWAVHISTLLREVRPDIDAETVGALLLSSIGGDLAQHLARAGEVTRLRAAVQEMVRAVLNVPS
ncbi:TetR family transcriptional regulator [Nocardia caishijiensis]|uniref:TetR family transcriptional regulator n=2 Tax=Nocardia caishijiensis TaxID=184756 RepID=A0ABQ6YNS3_9NOCA|nr:TetR family transcriptional regulator [Nocardia caishijiensis]